ncbi:hypothetical protein [Deinococcus yavapaiensis]|uniref:Uncharacterized protein n=1 Tax=Deinococcus yavapaiensis KR-236 TaxID=694435 RepID=A0A318SIU6_9DEIO|nr:hypothetical protein [Deinococcus yavapaiensis]PYE51843.1 hypothetical protein DES52_11444 [Deinococcus yavapaiensis KR-236]
MNLRTARTIGFVVLGLAALQLVGLFFDPARDGPNLLVGAFGVVAYALFGLGNIAPQRIPLLWGVAALALYGASLMVLRFAQGRWLEGGAFLVLLAGGAYVVLRARRR